MEQPPFRPALLSSAATWAGEANVPHADDVAQPAAAVDTAPTRLRLADMDSHLHCSVIGTCLSTAELRKLMARHFHVDGLSDLEVHHEAVRLASRDGEVSRTLHKALDRRHDAAVRRFAATKEAQALGELWRQALERGEVPGAYWAVLTHRRVSADLRQRAFGDVHMLSHLVGAANRADIRRLVALERENAEVKERAERQQERNHELLEERERERAACAAAELRCSQAEARLAQASRLALAPDAAQHETLTGAVALQTRRREEAENKARALAAELERVSAELERQRQHAGELARELAASEAELGARHDDTDNTPSALALALGGHKVLYVGGRPSSSTAIRGLVVRHGAEFQRHDGGLEDRKGALAAALAWASLVVFPVDCIDHDSALALKRSCQRQSVPFLALRSASIASFAAAVDAWARPAPRPDCGCGGPCLRHG